MSNIKSLFEMDGWRKFAIVVLAFTFAFILALVDEMSGDAVGWLFGSLGSAFITGEVGGYLVKTKAGGNTTTQAQGDPT